MWIHSLVAGIGYPWAVSDSLELFLQGGVGRFYMTGVDSVGGHVTATVDAGVRWRFAPAFALFADGTLTLGAAKIHADSAEGVLGRFWGVMLGFELAL